MQRLVTRVDLKTAIGVWRLNASRGDEKKCTREKCLLLLLVEYRMEGCFHGGDLEGESFPIH